MSDTSKIACKKCNGSGWYRDPRIWGTMPGSTKCPDCDGNGTTEKGEETIDERHK